MNLTDLSSANSAQRLGIVGAGSLGQQIAQHLHQSGIEVAGFFDDTLPKGQLLTMGTVLGGIANARQLFDQGQITGLMMGIGYRYLDRRQLLFEQLAAVIPFPSFVHPAAWVDSSAQLEAGCFVSPGCIIDINARLGPNTFLYSGCVVSHDTQLAGHSLLGPGVRLAGNVSVAERCFLGIGTTVIDGLSIGVDIVTGGGTVVVDSLSQTGLYVGVPARGLHVKENS